MVHTLVRHNTDRLVSDLPVVGQDRFRTVTQRFQAVEERPVARLRHSNHCVTASIIINIFLGDGEGVLTMSIRVFTFTFLLPRVRIFTNPQLLHHLKLVLQRPHARPTTAVTFSIRPAAFV